MIVQPETLFVFALAALAILAVPGPAVVYIVTRSIHQGRGAGLASVLGIHVGTLVHLTAATVGLSAILVSSASAFTVVKLLGALYLVVIGIRTLLGKADPDDTDPQRPPRRRRRDFAEGVVVNVLNPKTALFFLAFLPQFVDPDGYRAWEQILVLGLTFMAARPGHGLDVGARGRNGRRDAASKPPLGAHAALRLGLGLPRARGRDRPDRLAPQGLKQLGRRRAADGRRATQPGSEHDQPPPKAEIGSSSVTSSPEGSSASSSSISGSAPGAAAIRRRSTSSVEPRTTSSCLNGFGKRPSPEVPGVELLQEPGGAPLAQLPHGLANEENELCDDLLPRRFPLVAVHDLPQHPGVALRAAADHHRGGAGRGEYGLRAGARGDVARGDHRHVDQRHELGRERVVGEARVHLLRRAGMEREHGRARLDEPRPDVEAGAGAVPQPAAHLHRHRHVDRLRDRVDDAAGEIRVVEQRRARRPSSSPSAPDSRS